MTSDYAPDYRRLAAVGPYFAVDVPDGTDPGTDPDPDPGPALDPGSGPGAPEVRFRPLRDLYEPGPEGLLAGRIRAVAKQLGTAEPRVAASILQLGLAARFWSVGLGAAALLGTVPELHPDRASVRVPDQGPIDLWLPHHPAPTGPTVPTGPAGHADLAELTDRLHQHVVVEQLVPLAAAVRSVVPVSERLLWGNAASALMGALRVLHGYTARPEVVRPARFLAEQLLAREPLIGTHRSPDYRNAPFRRTNCCLYYRVGPGAGVCGDCCFDRPPR